MIRRKLLEVTFGVALVWMSIGGCNAADVSPSLVPPGPTAEIHILISESHADIEKWVKGPSSERGGDHGRRRIVSKGKKLYLPIAVTGYKTSGSGEISFVADLEIVDPNGKVTVMKNCCSAGRGDPRTPGLVILNPVMAMDFDSADPLGTYTVRATVAYVSSKAAVSESFQLVQAGTKARTDDGLLGDTQPSATSGPKKKSSVDEDARACLDLSTNIEIMRCAEKYR